MNHIQVFLSSRLTGIFCTLLSIIAINSIQQTIPNLSWDNSYSIAAAKNMSEGHGFSILMAEPADISKTYYKPLNFWPPGYSVLLILMHSLSPLDWIQSAFLLNAIGLSFLVLLFKKMLQQLETVQWLLNASVIYFGFLFHFFLGPSFTDIFALLFFMTGCSLLLQYVKGNQKDLYLVVLSAFFFAFSAWQKYLYFGLAFIPLLSLYFFGRKRKIKTIGSTSIIGICITGFLIGILIFFQLRNSGHAVYLKSSSSNGFFPLQLLELAPIVPGTFINLNFLTMQISGYTRLGYTSLFLSWSVINVLCICLLIRICWPMIKTTHYFKLEFRNFYSLMSLFVIGFLFLFLSTLTITYNSHYEDMNSWVFVGVARYFAPFCFLLFQLFAFLFQKPALIPNKTFHYAFRILMIFCMIEEISHGTYFIIKQVFIKKEIGFNRPSDQQQLRSGHLAQVERSKKDVVVVCTGLSDMSNFSSLTGTSAIRDHSIFRKPLYSSKEVVIITALDSFLANRMPSEFFKLDTRLVEQEAGYSWYITKIHPNIPSSP